MAWGDEDPVLMRSKGGEFGSADPSLAPKRRQSVLDQVGAFAQSATEQIPLLDEAAAGVISLTSGRPYREVRDIQNEMAEEDRRERPLARNAGGVAGFTATMAAPGGGYIKGAKSLPQAVSRSAQVGAAYGAAAGAGSGDGGVADRAMRAAGGAAVGGATGGALPLVGRGVSEALKKAPKTMTLAELEAAKRAAYADPALSGVVFTPEARGELARTLKNEMLKLRMTPKRHPAAASVLSDVVGDLKADRPLGLEDLDQLRQIVWRDAASLKDPNRSGEAMMGRRLMELLDDFADTADGSKVLAGDPQAAAAALGKARDLNTRWRKMQTVSNELDSADLRRAAAYTGANTDNTIRQRMRTLVDPTSGRRLRNASKDEQAALRRVVEGTKGQNTARNIGSAADPRKLGGKILAPLAASAGPATGWSSLMALAALPVGIAATTSANRASQKNVEGLLSLIAAGGSREALKKTPGKASGAARKLVGKGQELPGIAGLLADALAKGGL